MKKNLSIKELASKLVGDGKRPNKYFVTIAYGWYRPVSDGEMIQAKNSLDSATVFFTNKEDALSFFDSVPIDRYTDKVTGETIGQVMIEDRLTGVVKEKYLEQSNSGRFIRVSY